MIIAEKTERMARDADDHLLTGYLLGRLHGAADTERGTTTAAHERRRWARRVRERQAREVAR